jgi:lysophospholipase L1-like esterase
MAERLDLAATAREMFDEVPWRCYAALGDSVTEGVGDPVEGYPTGGWCQMLVDALRMVRSDLEYHNFGRRYLTTRQIRETQLGPALELEPDLVTLLAGGNDVLEQDLDLPATEAEFERIVSAFTERGATVVTLTMFDIFKANVLPPEGEAWLRPRLEGLHDVIRAVSDRHPVVLVDLALLPEGADPGIYSKDLQHGNMRGHFVNAEAVLRHLAEHARSRRVADPAAAEPA